MLQTLRYCLRPLHNSDGDPRHAQRNQDVQRTHRSLLLEHSKVLPPAVSTSELSLARKGACVWQLINSWAIWKWLIIKTEADFKYLLFPCSLVILSNYPKLLKRCLPTFGTKESSSINAAPLWMLVIIRNGL